MRRIYYYLILFAAFVGCGEGAATNQPGEIPISPTAALTTPSPMPPQVPFARLTTALTGDMFTDPVNTNFHNLIIFTSRYSIPLVNVVHNEFNPELYRENMEHYGYTFPQLWAFTPEGAGAGVLSDISQSHFARTFPIYFNPNSSSTHYSVEYDIHLNHDLFDPIQLPEVCDQSEDRCSGFQFSPDGRYLGFFYGPDRACNRGIMILETQSNEEVYSKEFGVINFRFLSNGKFLITSGHCEGANVGIFDPFTGEYTSIGPGGWEDMAPNHQAFVTFGHTYTGMIGYLNAYQFETGKIFLSVSGVIDNYVWTQDGSHLLYSIAVDTYSSPTDTSTITYNPMKVIIVPLGGSPQALLEDERFDYHLCDDSRCKWYGDWIAVRRTTTQDRVYPSFDDYDPCLEEGLRCPDPVDLFALNWRTGELIPWDEASLPAATPTPEPTPTPVDGPDMSREPLYVSPGGGYAYYVGVSGASLWLVPQSGAPVLWVVEGEDFIYVP